ncbi:Immune-associated nucleotide-binding protein 9 [Citrus sinensis]|nr:Immune-associated nucleotide-binding protein 9 [Citrus sinensis]
MAKVRRPIVFSEEEPSSRELEAWLVGVTKTCEMQRTKLKDGQVVNVIDTPGLFDSLAGSEFVGKEIVNCLGANKTKDAATRTEQVGKLLSVVNSVIVQNGGQPYTDEIFAGLKEGAAKLCDQQVEVESKLKETTTRLEQQLAEEHLARLKAEGAAQLAQMKKFLSLERNLERAQRETEENRNRVPQPPCPIL